MKKSMLTSASLAIAMMVGSTAAMAATATTTTTTNTTAVKAPAVPAVSTSTSTQKTTTTVTKKAPVKHTVKHHVKRGHHYAKGHKK